jgi:hypothetical protein
MNRKDMVRLSDDALMDAYDNAGTLSEMAPLREEILRRMGQDWRSRQRSEAGRAGGLARAHA